MLAGSRVLGAVRQESPLDAYWVLQHALSQLSETLSR
jgi:hypothetical protein